MAVGLIIVGLDAILSDIPIDTNSILLFFIMIVCAYKD